MAWQLWWTGDATPQRMILHDGCMEVFISLFVCVYSFGYLAQKVRGGGQSMLLKIVLGAWPPGSPGSYALARQRNAPC